MPRPRRRARPEIPVASCEPSTHREAIAEFVSPTTLRRGLCKGRVLLSLRTASPMLMRFGSLLRPAFKKIFDRAACARQARRYGANRHALHLRDFTICEALQNDQQQSMTLVVCQCRQSGFDVGGAGLWHRRIGSIIALKWRDRRPPRQ